jgi:hypothetical protein
MGTPMYLWDLFEPRGWCVSKRWARGWSQFVNGGDESGYGSRCVCRPEHHQQRQYQHQGHNHQKCLIATGLGKAPATPQAVVDTTPGSESYKAASLGEALGCATMTTASETSSQHHAPYRLLAAEAHTSAEWAALSAEICADRSSLAASSGAEEYESVVRMYPGGVGKHFDQVVLSVSLVGMDVIGYSAERRMQRDLMEPVSTSSSNGSRRLTWSANDASLGLWGMPAGATLGPIVECLEADGT